MCRWSPGFYFRSRLPLLWLLRDYDFATTGFFESWLEPNSIPSYLPNVLSPQSLAPVNLLVRFPVGKI